MFLNENDKSEFVEDRHENTVFDWRYNGCWQNNNQPTVEKRLAQQCFLDGDWCWDADPFQVTEETKEMVMHNICFLLNNFLRCTAYDNIILGWVMHNGGNENGHYYRVTINPIIYDNVSERISASGALRVTFMTRNVGDSLSTPVSCSTGNIQLNYQSIGSRAG